MKNTNIFKNEKHFFLSLRDMHKFKRTASYNQ